MNIEPPLLNLIQRCETICDKGCCGIDAYDFSPFHIASFLLMCDGTVNELEVNQIKSQLESLKINYGSNMASGATIAIEEMNQYFTGTRIDEFVDNLLEKIEVAIVLIENYTISFKS